MNNDSTRKRRVQKTLGLHYSRFYLIARCIDSLFQRKILENRSSAAPVEKVGLVIARQLLKVSVRAAGALVGVVIEGHLQKVAAAHNLKIAKKAPTIADLNDPLKAASVIDTAAWRKISFLGDLRNLCCHKKDTEPTKEQVIELIDGTEWLAKNIF